MPESYRSQQLSFTMVSGCDFLQTFPMEVRAIWSSRLTAPTLLFLLNRYSLFISLVTGIMVASPGYDSSLGLSCPALNVADGIFQTFSITATNPQLAISLSQIAFDTYVIVLTVKKTANYTTGMRRLTGNERSLSQVLLRDGMYYYTAVFVLAGMQAGMAVASFINPEIGSASLPSLLVNRVVLNLRNFDRKSRDTETELSTTALPHIQFEGSRWLGNIGAPLDHSQWERDLDDFPEVLGSEVLNDVQEEIVRNQAAVHSAEGTGSRC
ncbi:uncharacterized protein STEHIDRAFT_109094 [Stereum hirsutum FP-91666 SS1]|uniref:uncharacterized protein n=1 Tax=Stereum hirsutum (strain FP-91666) TaxID=721885 RepID=UPI000440E307|nr:uncharacterized protein STEHIDRAFT_109094 [Stereum hirsutum FP-91666 SS1]EIM88742.1 hypothetical protein STEHIDRAFT_109094 [Stereum hirsutum FP-91666 SS1]